MQNLKTLIRPIFCIPGTWGLQMGRREGQILTLLMTIVKHHHLSFSGVLSFYSSKGSKPFLIFKKPLLQSVPDFGVRLIDLWWIKSIIFLSFSEQELHVKLYYNRCFLSKTFNNIYLTYFAKAWNFRDPEQMETKYCMDVWKLNTGTFCKETKLIFMVDLSDFLWIRAKSFFHPISLDHIRVKSVLICKGFNHWPLRPRAPVAVWVPWD